MHYELCATCNLKRSDRAIGGGFAAPTIWRHLGGLVHRADNSLDWITERLDRKFVSAMERCANDDPNTRRELNLLKRTVLVLVCLGLGVTAVSIKFAVESQLALFVLG
jgi:hypothetical protein